MIKIFKLTCIGALLYVASVNGQSKFKQQEVYDKIVKANLQHPKIVLKQAIHESANFKSKATKNKNNILGIMKGSRLRDFPDIDSCIMFYKERVQSRYKTGNYYTFLKRIKYAADLRYIKKVKEIPLYIME